MNQENRIDAIDAPRLYTAYNSDIPGQLSYQNIKLANFIEIELTDINDTLYQLPPHPYNNQIKDCLSRSFNVFHEMKKLFDDLGMNFLYSQAKKLISGYSILFVFLQQKIQQLENQNCDKSLAIAKLTERKKKENGSYRTQIENEVRTSIEIVREKREKSNQIYKKFQGVHLFNESYSRHIDYDIEQFRRLREAVEKERKSSEQAGALLTREEQNLKFKKEIFQDFNDNLEKPLEEEGVVVFMNKHRQSSEQTKNYSLETELEKIANHFKDSQTEALQFLRQSKAQESFHQLTEGFNLVVEEHQKVKSSQINSMREKLASVLESFNKKSLSIDEALLRKQKEIVELREAIESAVKEKEDRSCQTICDFEDELKVANKKVGELELLNEDLKEYLRRCLEEEKKEKDKLIMQLGSRENELKQIRNLFEQKCELQERMEKKLRFLSESLKSKTNPLTYFQDIDEETKALLVEELKSNGFLTGKKQDSQTKIIPKNSSRLTPDYAVRKQSSYQPYKDKLLAYMLNDDRASNPSTHNRSKRKDSCMIAKNGKMDGEKTPISLSQFNDHGCNELEREASIRDNLTPHDDQFQISKLSTKKIIIHPKSSFEKPQDKQKIRVFQVQAFQSGKKINSLKEKEDPIMRRNFEANDSKAKIQIAQEKSKKHKINQKMNSMMDERQFESSSDFPFECDDGEMQKVKRDCVQKGSEEVVKMEENVKKRKDKKTKAENEKENFQNDRRILKSNEKIFPIEQQAVNYSEKQKGFQHAQVKNKSSDQTPQKINPKRSKTRTKRKEKEDLDSKQKFTSPRSDDLPNSLEENSCRSSLSSSSSLSSFVSEEGNPFIGEEKAVSLFRREPSITKQFDVTINERKNDKENKKEQITTKKKIGVEEQRKNNQHSETQKNFSSIYRRNPINSMFREDKIKKVTSRNESLANKAESASNVKRGRSKKQGNKSKLLQGDGFWNPDGEKQNPYLKETVYRNNFEGRFSEKLKMNKNTTHSNAAVQELLEIGFEDKQVRKAAEKAKSVDQFKQRVLLLHRTQCKQNCVHLSRYMSVFVRFRKMINQRRKQMKIHVENINGILSEESGSEERSVNLPLIRK